MESYDDFIELSVGALRDFLSARGIQTTGRRVELVARAFSAWEQNIPVILSNEQHSSSLLSEYGTRLRRYGLDDPNSCTEWQDDMTKWPNVDLGKIFSFILHHKEFDTTYIGKYKDRKAFSYWKSNFVGPIYYSTNRGGKCILKGVVTPSQRIRQDPHEVWIALDNSGTIHCGWCSCIAGTSASCNHIIALLYKVNYAVENGYTDPACTSVPCGWNHSTRREVQAGKIADMKVRRDKASKDRETEGVITAAWKAFDPRREGQRVVSQNQKKQFLEGLREIRPTSQIFKSVESDLHQQPRKQLLITECAEAYCSTLKGDETEQLKINGFLEKMALSDKDVDDIEKKTRGQSSSARWKEHRKGRITASNFKDVCSKVDSLSRSRGLVKPKTTPLIAKLIHGSDNIDHIPAIKWGRDNEDKALSEFHVIGLANHNNCKLSKTGLHVMDTKPFIGASPDGIMTCSCCGQSVIEIKCPYSIRNSAVADSWQETDFLEMKNNFIQLKREHKYYYQVMGQMAVTKIHKCHFLVWTLKELHTEIITFDSMFWADVQLKLEVFFKSYMVKVLLNLRTIYFCGACEKVILEGEELPPGSPDNSVSCDRCAVWFHFRCVQITNIEDDQEWLCSACIEDLVAD